MSSFIKDPDSILDYQFDWELWLNGDEIDTSVWVVPAGLTEDSKANTTTTTTVWLSAGVLGQRYEVTNRITTVGGRTEDRLFIVRIRER